MERQRLERALLHISESEQRRIGQDLHDSLGQNLTAVTYMARLLQTKLSARGIPEAQAAAEIVRAVSEAIDQVRSLSRGLYPVSLTSHGLAPALQELAALAEKKSGVHCEVHCDGSLSNDDTDIQLYRIAQEALNNALKHAEATRVSLSLTRRGSRGVLEVVNNGRPFRPSVNGGGLGLHIMRHRARVIGGTFSIRRTKGGSRVTCHFPWGEPRDD